MLAFHTMRLLTKVFRFSPVYYTNFDVTTVLGDITRNEDGNITAAKASLIQWFLKGDDKVSQP